MRIRLFREGRAKLLDFGIGQLMKEATASPATPTRDSGAALTPEFAALEQIEGGECRETGPAGTDRTDAVGRT